MSEIFSFIYVTHTRHLTKNLKKYCLKLFPCFCDLSSVSLIVEGMSHHTHWNVWNFHWKLSIMTNSCDDNFMKMKLIFPLEFETAYLPWCVWHLFHMPSQLQVTLFHISSADSFYYIFIAPPSIQACTGCPNHCLHVCLMCGADRLRLMGHFLLISDEGQVLLIDHTVSITPRFNGQYSVSKIY